jgi:hypothetical protein
VSQDIIEENSKEELRDIQQTNEERGPTGSSTGFIDANMGGATAMERIYEFIAFLKRIPCFDSINAPKVSGLAFEKAIASSISSSPRISYWILVGSIENFILIILELV